jgi:F-type H+-transporting ATPase subunit delta
MAKVATVFPLDDSLRDEFKHLIGQFTGQRAVELEEEINEELIGGYVLKLDGKQLDESLRGKLNELKLKFS